MRQLTAKVCLLNILSMTAAQVKCLGRRMGASACLRNAFSKCFGRCQQVFRSSVWFLCIVLSLVALFPWLVQSSLTQCKLTALTVSPSREFRSLVSQSLFARLGTVLHPTGAPSSDIPLTSSCLASLRVGVVVATLSLGAASVQCRVRPWLVAGTVACVFLLCLGWSG